MLYGQKHLHVFSSLALFVAAIAVLYLHRLGICHKWHLCKIFLSSGKIFLLLSTSNFLTNTTITTFQAGHLGKHLATNSGEKCHRTSQGDVEISSRQSSREEIGGTGPTGRTGHTGQTGQTKKFIGIKTFQDTCVGQLSQFLRCLLRSPILVDFQ